MQMGIERSEDKAAVASYFTLAREFKQTMSRANPTIHFVGLWDTVSSVGWVDNPLHLPWEANNPDIAIGRHAVSIDEHRAFFRSHLWHPPGNPTAARGPVDLQQVWFAGVHCDVGGGYKEIESGLSKYPLQWMLEEAKHAGLLVDAGREAEILGRAGEDFVQADANACMHKSLSGAWHLAEFIPKRHWNAQKRRWGRRMNLYRRRSIPPGSLVHESAYLRGNGYGKFIPGDAVCVETQRYSAPAPPEQPDMILRNATLSQTHHRGNTWNGRL
jgi:uncharacterized protein (DUF2235 family)